MTEFVFPHLGSEIFRLYVTDGVPASGTHEPEKLEIQEWMGVVEETFEVIDEHLDKYLAADTTIFVRTGGLDSAARSGLVNNDANAFATPQFAWTTIADRYNFNRKIVTIKCADGNYTGTNVISIDRPWNGGGILIFEGNTATPANCRLIATGGSAIVVDDAAAGEIRFQGFEVRSDVSYGLVNGSHANVLFGLMAFGFCDTHIATNQAQGHVTSNNNYTILDDAASFHLDAEAGDIKIRHACDIPVARDFNAFASARTMGTVNMESNAAFTGAGAAGVTGARFVTQEGGIIYVEGNDDEFFPGNVAGVAASVGSYIGATTIWGAPDVEM